MPAPYPEFISEAFAISAAPADRNTIPATPVSTQRASLDLGFPPLVMTPVVAGGKPMLGPDMNGILYMLSTHTVYQQSGKLYRYSALVSAALGGYEIGTLLGSTDGQTVWYNLTAANTTDPDSGGAAGWLALFSYGLSNITALVGGSRTLTLAESSKTLIVLTGALVANQQIVLPATFQTWLIVNATTGAFVVTVKTAAQVTGVTIPAGGYASPTGVYGNGVDINLTYSPAALPLDVNPTANTIAQRDNIGYLYAASPTPVEDSTRVATTEMVQDVASAVVAQALVNAKAAALGGTSQTWQAVGRALNGVYQNTTGRPIQVLATISCPASPIARFRIVVNSVILGGNFGNGAAGAIDIPASFIVPDQALYAIQTVSGSPSLIGWAELR